MSPAELDIDTVTDRYLRRFGDPIDRTLGFVWPRDSFHWASTRAGLATARLRHGFRNVGLGMRSFARAADRAAIEMAAFAESFRRTLPPR